MNFDEKKKTISDRKSEESVRQHVILSEESQWELASQPVCFSFASSTLRSIASRNGITFSQYRAVLSKPVHVQMFTADFDEEIFSTRIWNMKNKL